MYIIGVYFRCISHARLVLGRVRKLYGENSVVTKTSIICALPIICK